MKKTVHHMIVLICLLGLCFPIRAEVLSNEVGKDRTGLSLQKIDESQFRKTFIHFLCRHLGKEKQDIIVSKLKIVGNKPVPLGKLSFQLFQDDKREFKGYMRLAALVYVDGAVKNKVKLFGRVDIFDSVVCVTRDLKRGETITQDDIYLARKNVSHVNRKALTDAGKAIGLMTKHNIKANTCLKEWMLEKSPIVTRGDVVTILAESDGLKVTAPGRVLGKGYSGELVKIQNLMSKKEIYAKVINSSTVKVDF